MSHHREPHATRILAHLKQNRSIDPLTALRLFGCYRLAARIAELRQAGHVITTHHEQPDDLRQAAHTVYRYRAGPVACTSTGLPDNPPPADAGTASPPNDNVHTACPDNPRTYTLPPAPLVPSAAARAALAAISSPPYTATDPPPDAARPEFALTARDPGESPQIPVPCDHLSPAPPGEQLPLL